jgi:hypothetical protein
MSNRNLTRSGFSLRPLQTELNFSRVGDLAPPPGRMLGLLNKPDRHRVATKLPVARLDRGDD